MRHIVNHRHTRLLLVAAALAGSTIPRAMMAQAGPPAANTPGTQMVRAAGMPLDDGTLPPGSLTVRVVEGAFTRNLHGITVQAQLEGGRTERAVTGDDGRAAFAHLPAGARVRVTANAGAEHLESETFAMPSQNGVRVLLVAESLGSVPDDSRPLAPTASARPAGPIPQANAPSRRLPPGADLALVGAFAAITMLVLLMMSVPRWRRARPRPLQGHDRDPHGEDPAGHHTGRGLAAGD